MRFALPALLAGTFLLAACSSSSESQATEKPGMIGRMWGSTKKLNPFDRDLKPREMKERESLNLKSLALEVSVDPPAPKLGEQRQVAVRVRLSNKGKKLAPLDFPTSQRVEVIVRNKIGNTIERWSEDQAFVKEPGVLAINPGERVEYNLTVSTREMSAGEPYTVEAFFPSYNSLRGTATIVPVR